MSTRDELAAVAEKMAVLAAEQYRLEDLYRDELAGESARLLRQHRENGTYPGDDPHLRAINHELDDLRQDAMCRLTGNVRLPARFAGAAFG